MSAPSTETASPTNPTVGTPLAAAQPRCGFMIPTGTESNGIKVSKPCMKDQGHDGEHSLRNYSKVDTSVIKLDAMDDALEPIPADERVEGLTERVRDERQQKADAHVLAAHKKWTEVGKPAGFQDAVNKGAGQRYFIEPNEADAYRALLKSAAKHHTANGTPIHVRVIPPKRHTDGRTMLYWIAVDKREETAEQKAKREAAKAKADAEKAKAGQATLADVVRVAKETGVQVEDIVKPTPKPSAPRK